MEECKDCICSKCKFKPCEDCYTCDEEGYKPSNECQSFEK